MDQNYDYHIIIKELAKQFEGEFNGSGEKYKTFPVPVTNNAKKID